MLKRFLLSTVLLISIFFFACQKDTTLGKIDDEESNENPTDGEPDSLTAVGRFGQLRVSGNRIVDKNGDPIQLRGMSFFWSQWIGKYYTPETVAWLKEDWNINIIRAAMAVDNGGYASNVSEQNKIMTVIDAAIDEGIYVIVDFHVHDGDKYLSEAKTFFKTIAQKYGDQPNLIYEPWNEPVHHSWSEVIKPYHEEVIKVIREYDPDNIIACGSSTWSQDVDVASADPLLDENVVYTLHFYAATHGSQLRQKATAALNRGVAIMVTEYGTCEASGNGEIDSAETRAWWNFLDENFISHCNWSVADKEESASALKPGASPTGQWTDDQITISGNLVRDEILSKNK